MDKLLKAQSVHITKCLTGVEGPPKTKHVRGIILGTHYLQGASQFFHLSHQLDLQNNPIICYKFFFVLHKILREGHENCVKDALRNVDGVVRLGKHWYQFHQRNPYGLCVVALSKVIIQKLRFHKKYASLPGSLSVTGEKIAEMTGHDMNTLYELTLDLLDYLEEILKYEEVVFSSLDKSRNNSMTYEGQCRLTPILQCVQDSATLYDTIVKLMFQLHAVLAGESLSGHRERFVKLYNRLSLFYDQAKQMQFFKNLIHIPMLPATPPNFLIQSELEHHQAPVVSVEEPVPELEEEEDLLDLNNMKNIEEQLANEQRRTAMIENEALQDQLNKLRSWFDEQSALLRARIRSLEEELKLLVQQKSQLEDEIERLKRSCEASESFDPDQVEKFNRLTTVYTKLRNEHVELLRKHSNLNEELHGVHNTFLAKEGEIMNVCAFVRELQHEHGMIQERQQQGAALSQSQLIGTTTQLMDVERALSMLQLQCDALRTDAQDNTKKMQEYSAQLTHWERSQRETDNHIRQLQDLVNSTHDRKRVLKERCERTSIDISQMQQRINEFESVMRRYAHLQPRALLRSQCDACCARLRNVQKTLHDPELMNSRGSAELLVTHINGVCDIHHSVLAAVDRFKMDDQSLPDLLANLTKLSGNVSHTLLHLKAVSNGAQSLEQADHLLQTAESIIEKSVQWLQNLGADAPLASQQGTHLLELWTSLRNYISSSDMMRRTASISEEVGDLVDQEMKATDEAIEAAQRRFKELLDQSRAKLSGQQLAVNESILESCTKLMHAIKVLVEKSKILQREIVAEGRGLTTTSEFYKKHHRWTEGLISAAKAIGLGATVLVKEADRVVNREAGVRPEQLEICSREISSSTVQLVVTSRVKAKPQSPSLRQLMEASSDVTKASSAVVASAKTAAEIMDREITYDFSHLSLTQTKKTEMDSQVKVLQLETQLTEELRRLGELRKQHYKLEEMNVATN